MPATGNCHVLITTRKNGGFAYIKGFGLEALAEADAWSLITGGKECRDDRETQALRQLCTELEFLTLELAVVRGILAKGGMQPSKLLDILRKKGEWSRPPADPGFRNRDVKLRKLFDESLAAMRRGASGEGLELAERMALVGGWFASAVIRTRLLVSAVQNSGHGGSMEDLVEIAEDEGVPLLVEYSLATGNGTAVRFHRLVQNYMRYHAPDMWRAVLHAVSEEGMLGEDVEHFRVVWNRSLEDSHSHDPIFRSMKVGLELAYFIGIELLECKEAEMIVEECSQKIKAPSRELGEGMPHRDVIQQVGLIQKLNGVKGRLLNYMGRYEEAEVAFEKGLEGTASVFGYEHPTSLGFRNNLALNLGEQGRLADSESEHRSVLEARQRVLGPEHQDTLTSRNNLAKVLIELGQHAGIAEELREVLQIRERVLGPKDPDTLDSRNTIALLLQRQGRFAEAQAERSAVLEIMKDRLGTKEVGNSLVDTLLIRQNLAAMSVECHGRYAEAEGEQRALLEKMESLKGTDHPNSLDIRSNLAITFAKQGLHAKSESEHRRVLEARVRVLGDEDPASLNSRSNVASLCYVQARYPEAEKEFRALLEISQRVPGPEHPDVLTYRYGLAGVLQAQGHLALAAAEFNALVKILEPMYGAEHPDTLRARYALAVVLQKQGQHEEAEKEHRTIFETRSRKLGAESPLTLMSREILAATMQGQGRYKDAETEHRALLEPMERVLGAEHPDTLSNCHNLAFALRKQGRNKESEAMFRVVLKIRERVLGEQHVDTLSSRHNLAMTLRKQGRHTEAEEEQRAVIGMMARVRGAEHEGTLCCRHYLAVTLQEQGRYAEAEVEHRAVREMRVRMLGVEHPDTLRTRKALMKTLRQLGKSAEAEMELRSVLESRERDLGVEHPLTLASRGHLTVVMMRMEGWHEEASYEIAYIRKALPHMPPEPSLASMLNSLAWRMQADCDSGYLPLVEAFARKAVEMERVLEADGVSRENALDTLAVVLQKQGKLEEALSFAQEAVGIVNAKGWQGEDPADIQETLENIEAAIAFLAEKGHLFVTSQ